MLANTKAATGRMSFDISHLDDMKAVTNQDLKQWSVYAGYVEYKDGSFTVRAYTRYSSIITYPLYSCYILKKRAAWLVPMDNRLLPHYGHGCVKVETTVRYLKTERV